MGDSHSTPVETTIGGLPATRITMSLDASFDLKACNVAALQEILQSVSFENLPVGRRS